MLISPTGKMARKPNTAKGQALYAKARKLIPGATQLFSKRAELCLPGGWPTYYTKTKGATVTDLDGNRYLDVSHFGVGTCTLGFCDPDVDAAVLEAVRVGSMSTLNCPEEVELAELLLELHPWAEMVRYARCGGEALAIAIRIARAATGRDKIAFSGYHGWHDWYLAANLAEDHALDGHLLAGLVPAGVPRGLTGTMLPFNNNCMEELRAIVAQHGHELAAIVMEPARNELPCLEVLAEVRQLADSVGAVLIFDEVTSGWRMNTGGIHMTTPVRPDIAVFAKAISNGYAMAAIIGTRAVMESAQATFISSTYWTERIGPAAALATIRKHRRNNVPGHLIDVGNRVQAGWQEAAAQVGLKVRVSGIPPLSHFTLEYENPLVLTTLFIQLMLDRGFLASAVLYASCAHTPEIVERYLDAVTEAFAVMHQAVEEGNVMKLLRGPVKHGSFQRLN